MQDKPNYKPKYQNELKYKINIHEYMLTYRND